MMKPLSERKYNDFGKTAFLLILSIIVCESTAQGLREQSEIIKEWASSDLFSEETKTDIGKLPIRVDIKKACVLAVHNMNSQFDRDKQDEPYVCAELMELVK